MDDCPQYSRALFNELLRFRNVTVKTKSKQSQQSELSSSRDISRKLLFERIQAEINASAEEDMADTSASDVEDQLIMPDIHRLVLFRRSNANPDFFYDPSRDTEEEYRYVCVKAVLGDRRYSNNTETNSRCTEKIFLDSIRENKAIKKIWEQNDDLTKTETSVFALRETGGLDKYNGGVYDPYRPGLYTLSYRDPMQLLELLPATKFRDLLQLHGRYSFSLSGIEDSRKGKGNLSCLISGGAGPDILAVAHMSEIIIYEFDEISNGIKRTPSLKFETRPNITTNEHVQNLTWPFYPHTINNLKCYDDWVNGPVFVACFDDGRVLLWDKIAILDAISKHKYKSLRNLSASHVVEVKSSAWGIDFITRSTNSGEKHHIMCISANTATISLFYFDKNGQNFVSVESHRLSHNIPEVAFIDYQVNDHKHLAIFSCTTIQKELIIFKAMFTLKSLNKSETKKMLVNFQPPEVVRRTELDGNAWTCKPIHAKYFKKVQSLRALTGDANINEMNEAANILCESKILDPEGKSSPSLSFGIASYWQYFETPVVDLSKAPLEQDTSVKCQCVNEEHQRIHLAYKLLCTFEGKKDPVFKSLENVFLAVSSKKSLYLYRADTLFCTAATRPAFNLKIPCYEEAAWCDRISISCILPELSSFIAVTQIGLVTIMRMCKHKGVYGMRQEHLFPNALALSSKDDIQRTIIGLSSRNLSLLAEFPRYLLYFIYSDGFTLTYELRTKSDSELEILEI